jgi:uncharacterized membrane protein YccC
MHEHVADRPDRSGAALAGYTAAIIALPAFGEPHLLTQMAVARCTETMLGNVCAAVAGRLILPQLARETLVERLVAANAGMARFAAGPAKLGDDTAAALNLAASLRLIAAVVADHAAFFTAPRAS